MAGNLRLSILGPIAASVDGRPVVLGGPKQRSVFALLLLDPGHVVSVDRLIDGVWGDDPHDRAQSTLQVYVSNLRKAFVDAGLERELIVTQRPGYTVVVGEDELDLLVFDRLRRQAAAMLDDDPLGALDLVDQALALWRGVPFADVEHEPFAMAAAVGLLEQRDAVTEQRFDAALAAGRHREIVGELETAVATHPLREGLWGRLMVALYRSGRQADALAAYRRAREALLDQLGVDPGPELRDLESRVLAQDPRLAVGPPARPVPPPLDPTVRRVMPDRPGVLVLPGGERIDLGDRTVSIGRDPECDVVLGSADVSRRHASIWPTADGHEVRDLDSTNGVTVNGDPVTRRDLQAGDVIGIGNARLRYEL